MNNNLDQYYTNPTIAQVCMNTIYDIVDIDTIDVVVEPSAGTGSFFNLMDASKSIGMDLDPKYPNVIAQDYFSFGL